MQPALSEPFPTFPFPWPFPGGRALELGRLEGGAKVNLMPGKRRHCDSVKSLFHHHKCPNVHLQILSKTHSIESRKSDSRLSNQRPIAQRSSTIKLPTDLHATTVLCLSAGLHLSSLGLIAVSICIFLYLYNLWSYLLPSLLVPGAEPPLSFPYVPLSFNLPVALPLPRLRTPVPGIGFALDYENIVSPAPTTSVVLPCNNDFCPTKDCHFRLPSREPKLALPEKSRPSSTSRILSTSLQYGSQGW